MIPPSRPAGPDVIVTILGGASGRRRQATGSGQRFCRGRAVADNGRHQSMTEVILVPTDTRRPTVEAEQRNGRCVVTVHGEIDLATVAGLEEALCAVCLDSDGQVVVDLSDVTFMSCRGLAALASTHDGLAARGRTLVIEHPVPTVRKVLRLAGLDALCDR
jgi:anti-anti-sigma factor